MNLETTSDTPRPRYDWMHVEPRGEVILQFVGRRVAIGWIRLKTASDDRIEVSLEGASEQCVGTTTMWRLLRVALPWLLATSAPGCSAGPHCPYS
jgi:hypothetical protein